MNLAITIIITLLSFGVFFFLMYILLMPTKKNWPVPEERICPRCGKSDYKMVAASDSGLNLILGMGNPHYVCNNCKYKGVFPLINKEDNERKI